MPKPPTLAAALAFAVLFSILTPSVALAATPSIQHGLEVRIDPASGTLTVQDQMGLPDGESEWLLLLHAGLDPKVIAGDAELIPAGDFEHLTRYRLRRRAPGPVTLSYGGRIRHGLERIDEGMGRARQWSLGTIDPNGVFLDGNSGWYPRIPDRLHTFRLQVRLPEGWTAVSQGGGPGAPETGLSTWSETQPQDNIYLIAAPFRLYRKPAEGFEAQVYLRRPDDALAQTYLDATAKYVALYSDLIGPYPFAKFALVENFWETGYGMPSFTLLGPSVIRLPFIVDTSYPHEILHNWWGNGVYVDYASGNWSEGLTNYLADYWLKERVGQGAEYRRETLKSFADYVRDGKDFPLTEFRGRHGTASQAIGYGKGAMLFHMLRKQLGDETFNQGLRRFYAENRWRAASYADLQQAFEAVGAGDLQAFFAAWTTRPGAPRLALTEVRLTPSGEEYRITGRIEQIQSAPPFPLQVPVVIHRHASDPMTLIVESDERSTPFDITLASAPERLAVDPAFDVFRDLLPGETPVTLGNLFGADRGLILLPSAAPAPLLDAYRQLAETWRQGHPAWRLQLDREVSELPDDRPLWLLGWENRHLGTFASEAPDFTLDAAENHLRIGDNPLDVTDSPILTRWRGHQPLAWLATKDAAALPALARKLPHYGKYSYLTFTGTEATNQLKGQWPTGDSALVHWFGATPRPE
ncbi:M1 family metallopeptidase [Thiocystis violascens]|uniref:Peptidase M1 membrane alanine aminopeptidase domain-containing protein n=1 Tax=Thiocystis violascens (strain ATCC 17096 / DSM 198 / 6111) TaxID=765911 RepID=I3YA34_THIV6|nr:M1 family aminopeptidase [Thiocystis violascens]AFL73852.1 hypothetical protein Thivi_1883 [Thiocystis violascens DSM 198]